MTSSPNWLDRRATALVLMLLAALPLLWPQVPPLIDVIGHMGRYRVETARDVASLATGFGFEWRLIGNLGIDLLIVPLAPLIGVEAGTKLIVILIPVLTVASLLWLSREVHGRVQPHLLFALPLAYGFPFHFGFINFCLSVALSLAALALWIRLGRQQRLRLRAGLFLVIGALLWVVHMVGWGMLGIGAFGAEFVRLRRAGRGVVAAGLGAGIACLPLAAAFGLIALVKSESPQARSWDFFNWWAKLYWVLSLVRDRWRDLDIISAAIVYLMILTALVDRRLRVDPVLALPALLGLGVFVLMPRVAVGSAYADMRLLPWIAMLALAAVAVRPGHARLATVIACAGLAFVGLRTGATTASFLLYDRLHRDEARALEHLPRGAPVLSLVARNCRWEWTTARTEHLPALAIVRRDSFTNDQWAVDNAQLISIRQPGVGRYGRDPSHIVFPKWCRGGEGSDLDRAVAEFNRRAFDYVWTIHAPPGAVRAADLTLVWTNGRSALYRVVK